MQNATTDLLRLILTASAVVGFLLYANFEAASVVPPRAAAMARIDSPRNVTSLSAERIGTRASPTDAVAGHAGKFRTLLAFAQ